MSLPRSSERRPWVLAASDHAYRALLLACPAAFRRQYGEEVTQVFRTCCQDALRQGGAPAVLRLWMRSLGDLAVTALSEHMTGGNNVSRAVLMRMTGLAAVAGGTLWLAILVIGYGLGFVASTLLQWNVTWLTQLYFFGSPSIWLLFGVALIGLHLRMAIAPRWLGTLSLTISLVGVLALFVGNLGMGYIWALNSSPEHYLGFPSPAIMQFDTQLYTAAFVGYLVLGLGMFLSGVLAVTRRALPRYNAWVLAMGVLVALQYFFTDMGAPSLLRNTGTPGLLVMAGENVIFLLVWSIGWILIGRLLWSEGGSVVATPAPAVPGA
jgi:hypothetical protein